MNENENVTLEDTISTDSDLFFEELHARSGELMKAGVHPLAVATGAAALFLHMTAFLAMIADEPVSKSEWEEGVRLMIDSMKGDFYESFAESAKIAMAEEAAV